jgi:OTU domain-containing protein 6
MTRELASHVIMAWLTDHHDERVLAAHISNLMTTTAFSRNSSSFGVSTKHSLVLLHGGTVEFFSAPKNMVSREELESNHKKALKALEGEKRASLKKAKALKGTKGRDALEAADKDYAIKLSNLEASYHESLATLELESIQISSNEEEREGGLTLAQETLSLDLEKKDTVEPSAGVTVEHEEERERKRAKARRKREKQKERDAKKEEQVELENANAGPSLGKVEMEQIRALLAPKKLSIREMEADGHCLYRAVAAQTNKDYKEIRR